MAQYNSGRTAKFVFDGCRFQLDSVMELEILVMDICKHIGMTILRLPVSGRVQDCGEDDGVSVVLLIKESHIAIHAWPFYNAIRIVIDSCKDFDEDDLEKFFWRVLNPARRLMPQEIST